MDRGDPEGVDVAEGRAQCGEPLVPGGARHDGRRVRAVEPELCPLVKHPGRVTGLVPLDPAARRIRGRGIDPGGRERGGARGDDVLADPAQDDRPSVAGGVELVTVGQTPLREAGRGQGVALDPAARRIPRNALRDVTEHVPDGSRRQSGEVDRQATDDGRPVEVRVAVDQAREDGPAGKIDDLRSGTDEGVDVGVGAEREDAPAVDRDGGSVGPVGHRPVDPSVPQDHLGRSGRRPVHHR